MGCFQFIQSFIRLNLIVFDELGVVQGDIRERLIQLFLPIHRIHEFSAYFIAVDSIADDPDASYRGNSDFFSYFREKMCIDENYSLFI